MHLLKASEEPTLEFGVQFIRHYDTVCAIYTVKFIAVFLLVDSASTYERRLFRSQMKNSVMVYLIYTFWFYLPLSQSLRLDWAIEKQCNKNASVIYSAQHISLAL